MESTLHVSRNDLIRAIGTYLGWHVNTGQWTPTQHQRAGDIIAKGLRQFYQPPILPGERNSHEWSFLRPLWTMTTVSDQWQYDLPDDFGGTFDGDLTFSADDDAGATVRIVSDVRIRTMQQHEVLGTVESTRPTEAAIVPLESDGDEPQRYSILFWPTPGGGYEITGRYYSNPNGISASKPFPMGGQPHAETLRASVLAAAELLLNDTQGPHWTDYIERLRTSVNHDRRAGSPMHFGYNGDPSMCRNPVPRQQQFVTVNGVLY